jgi:hypothetical protein
MNDIREIDRIKDFETRIHQAALMYAQQGIPVVPLRPGSKILPERKTGINYFSRTIKLKTMDKWFGENGRYRGWNIGIPCGEDLFAIDLDLHGRENGIENWMVVASGRELNCPIQETPTGGRHMLLQWRENLTSSSGKLARGVDTRGGDGQPRSHIVAWPSIVKWVDKDGKDQSGAYGWVEGGDVPETPEWVSDIMGVPWASKPGLGNENVGPDSLETPYNPSQIAAMLDHIDANTLSYEEWLFVGQAINSQHPDKDGLQLWDTWSATGERYIHGECEKRWPGFNPAGTIRIGSLIYFAKEGGYDPSSDPARAGDFGDLVQAMNEDNAVLLTGGKIRIVHRDKVGGIHIMGTQDFNTLMYNRKVSVPLKRGKTPTEADIWMAHPDRRECIRGMGFFPDEGLWHDGYVNLWQGWGVKPEEGDWSLFDNHIKEVLCEDNEELHNFVLDWIADIIQDPMTPKGTAIVMHGEEGIGKGTFCEMVGRIVGKAHYKHVTNPRHLTGNFNKLLMDALLVFADEVIYGGDRQTRGIIKSMVTEKEMVCEPKGIDPFMCESRMRLAVASNEEWFIPAGPESRRWLVLEVSNKYANDKRYFNNLYDQMFDNGGLAAMMFDLQARKIRSNLAKAIVTRGLITQREIYKSTGDSVDIWMDRCIAKADLGCADQGEGGWPSDVDRMALFEAYDLWLGNQKGLRSKGVAHFYRKVESYGFSKHRPRPEGGGARRWRYKVPKHELFTTES